MKNGRIRSRPSNAGSKGWLLLWLFGVPGPLLALLLLLRGLLYRKS